MESKIEKIILELKDNIYESAIISTKDVEFATWVLDACQSNTCGRYGKYWNCPPAVGSFDDIKAKVLKYQKSFVFTTKHNLSDSFDFEGMMEAKLSHSKIKDIIINKVNDSGFYFLGNGGVCPCSECTYPHSPCRNKDTISPSLEAVGIDVVSLANTAKVKYNNGKDTVTYFSAIFFND